MRLRSCVCGRSGVTVDARGVSVERPVRPDWAAVGESLVGVLLAGGLFGRFEFCPDPHPGQVREERLLHPLGHLPKRPGPQASWWLLLG